MQKLQLVLSFVGTLFVSSCATVQVPVIEACTVNGRITNGALCGNSADDVVREITFGELVKMLEPQPEWVDPVSGNKIPERGGAWITSNEDFTKVKTALDQACRLLKNRCTYEIKKTIETLSVRAERLQDLIAQ